MTNIRAAAKTIAAARRNRTPLPPFAGDAAPQTEAEGYRIQAAVHGLLSADFGALVGYKIGCTSKVMQQYLDIPTTAKLTGKPWARRRWWPTISSPPAACSENPSRDPPRPICLAWSAARSSTATRQIG